MYFKLRPFRSTVTPPTRARTHTHAHTNEVQRHNSASVHLVIINITMQYAAGEHQMQLIIISPNTGAHD